MNEMSTADARNTLGQFLNAFRWAKRGEELIAYLDSLDERVKAGELAAARSDQAVAAAGERERAALERAAVAERDSAARVQRAKDEAAGAETDSHRRIALAQAEADGLIASSRADADRQVEEIAAVIAARRGELAEINTQLDEARSALAAIRARLG